MLIILDFLPKTSINIYFFTKFRCSGLTPNHRSQLSIGLTIKRRKNKKTEKNKTIIHKYQQVLDRVRKQIITDPPPSVFISQKTLNGLPFPSGSIQYSPFPLESPTSKICWQDLAAFTEDPNIAKIERKY